MAKLSYEDKKEIIRLYNECHLGYGTIAYKFNVCDSTIKYFVSKYNMHGESILIKKKNKKLSQETKLEILNRLINGESKNTLIIEYNITATQIVNWLKKYVEIGYNGLIDKPRGRPKTMKKEKKIIDPNDKDAIIKEKDQRILELEAEVEALKN